MTRSELTAPADISQLPLETGKPAIPGWIVDNIAETSKNAQQVFFVLVTLLVYSAISITGTSDRQVVLNSTVELPILNSTVSLEVFFLIAPPLAMLVFIYFQFYLQHLKGLLRQLEQNYRAPEPRRLYPWVLTIAEDSEPGSVGKLQKLFTDLSVWWLLPAVLLLFAMWSVRKHSPWLSYWVCVYPLMGLSLVLFFWKRYAQPSDKHYSRASMHALWIVTLVAELMIACYLIPAANLGWFQYPSSIGWQSPHFQTVWSWMMGRWTCVDLSYQVLVTEQKNEYDTYWVDLENSHLEGANLTHTILKLANLRGAHLQGANLKDTTLRTAMLEGADFRGAVMTGADLSYAKLKGAKNLTREQVCKARTLYAAKMDAGLEATVKSACPNVLSVASQDWS